MVRRLAAYVSAVLITTILGSIAHSLFIQQAWIQAAGADAQIPTGERISWITHDLVGLQPLYGGLVAAALLVAFLASDLLARYTGLRTIVFAVAGAIAMFTMFTIMRMELGTVGVFGARGTMGLAAQMAAGLIAGLVFAVITTPSEDH
jgi:cellobiose-specific phosphotransferase system component IIC